MDSRKEMAVGFARIELESGEWACCLEMEVYDGFGGVGNGESCEGAWNGMGI